MLTGAVACPRPWPRKSSSQPPITYQDTFAPFCCRACPYD